MRAGAKSARAFYVNLAHANIFLHDGEIEVFSDRPAKDNKGFEPDRGPISLQDISMLAALILRVLREAPRMPPS